MDVAAEAEREVAARPSSGRCTGKKDPQTLTTGHKEPARQTTKEREN